MRAIRTEDFEKMARQAVDEYLQQKTPLADSVTKTALAEEMNPDQIRNLVQLANTMAHLSLFDQKTDGDKVVEFEPADPDTVLKKVYKDTPSISATPGTPSNVQDMFGDLHSALEAVTNATTDTSPPADANGTPAASSAKGQMLIIKIRKVAADLSDRKLQAAFNYKEGLDKLAAEFAKLYGPNYEEFEKDALALRGELAVPVLNDMRYCLRMPCVKAAVFEKTARVVDSNTQELRRLDQLIKLAAEYEECETAVTKLQNEVGGLL